MSFLTQLTKIINTGQARAIFLTGNIYDLFFDGTKYVPLIDYLMVKCRSEHIKDKQKGITQIVWQVNRQVEIIGDHKELSEAWTQIRDKGKSIDERLEATNDNGTYTFELLRQITECSRQAKLNNNLLMLIEQADLLLPECEINRMLLPDRKRVAVVHDWFSDPEFVSGHDSVVLIAESRSLVHHRIARLPQVVSIEIPLPDLEQRRHFIEMFVKSKNLTIKIDGIAEQTAGLSIHALRQLLCSGDVSIGNIAVKVEQYMISQLGDGVIEFKRPTHKLADCVGFKRIKEFLTNEVIPGFKADKDTAIAGAAVAGPIGGGKTFICEAVASEIGMPVIVLKNLRSKWFGETDQIFERLRRILETFYKIMIFVDEADTMFGDVQSDHDTERRLTGKIQAMMSDPELRGRVIWFLMTARIHRLSPDIRRPGRMDLIIPILDPEGEDHEAFVKWTFGSLVEQKGGKELVQITRNYSSASFSMLRSMLKSKKCTTVEEALRIATDIISPDIEDTRLYQTLQAKLNCTRRSLLVDPSMSAEGFATERKSWKQVVATLEGQGIK